MLIAVKKIYIIILGILLFPIRCCPVLGQFEYTHIGGGRGQWLGGTMASAEHELITGFWG